MSRFTGLVAATVGAVRAHSLRTLAFGALIGASACLDDSPVAPSAGAVRLAINAQVGPGPGERAVAIRVYYLRQNEDRIDLPATPSQVNVPRGGTSTQQVTVQISECLADPQRMMGESESGCHLFIELRLLDDDGEFISEQTQEVEASRPGEQVPVAPFNLPQAAVGLSSTTAAFEATRYDEGAPSPATISVFSTTGASLGDLSEDVSYPGESAVAWLAVSNEDGVLTLRPDRTNLVPGTHTATVRVSASRDGAAEGTIEVTYVIRPLTGGGDLVLFGDGNFFDATALANADNQRLADNLATYGHPGARGTATQVQIDCGRQSAGGYLCQGGLGALTSALASAGYETVVNPSTAGSLTSIAASIKVLMLIMPCEAFDFEEVNTLKQFAVEGGRVVMASEFQDFYGDNWQTCSAAQNALARNLGTQVGLTGGQHSCNYNTLPAESLRPHQITAAMASVTMGCSSEVFADTSARPLFYDLFNEVRIAVADRIDTEPVIPTLTNVETARSRFDLRLPPLAPWAATRPSPTGR